MLLYIYANLVLITLCFTITWIVSEVIAHIIKKRETIKYQKIRITILFIICILFIARTYTLIGHGYILEDLLASIFYLICGIYYYLKLNKRNYNDREK